MKPSRESALQLIAPRGFLRSYLDYASGLTDAPREFHLAVGLGIIAGAVGNAVKFRGLGGGYNHPNLFLLILGESGRVRKSTSIGIGADLLEVANPLTFLPNEFSRERLVMNLAERPAGILRVPEFSTLLAAMSKDYMIGTREFITDLYDYHESYVRKTLQNSITVRDPCISIIGASTTDWMVEHLKPEDLRGGFIGRFMMIVGKTRGQWRGLADWGSGQLRDELIAWLKRINTMAPATVDFTPVKADFNSWLKGLEHSSELDREAPELLGFTSRIGAHALKLCVLFQISADGPQQNYRIGNNAFISAMTTIETILIEDLRELMETKLVFSKQERQMQALLERIGPNGGIDRSRLLRSSHLTSQDFDRLMGTLLDRGEVKYDSKSTGGRPVKLYYRSPSPSAQSTPSEDLPEAVSEPEWLRG